MKWSKIWFLWAETTYLVASIIFDILPFVEEDSLFALFKTSWTTWTPAMDLWPFDSGTDMAADSGSQVPLVQDDCLGIVAWRLSRNSGSKQMTMGWIPPNWYILMAVYAMVYSMVVWVSPPYIYYIYTFIIWYIYISSSRYNPQTRWFLNASKLLPHLCLEVENI